MRLFFQYVYYGSIGLLRQPMYVLSTLVFPSLFFWFFGVPNAKENAGALLLTGSFSAYAVVGVVVFQFGVAIAQDRGTPWSRYLEVLPGPSWVNLVARVTTGLLFAIITVLGVFLTSLAFTPAEWTFTLAGRLFFWVLVGSWPFALLGLLIGLMASPQAALPLANLIYLPLSFAGGLWMPPDILPEAVRQISPYLPTRAYGEIVWGAVLSRPVPEVYFWRLGFWGLAFLGALVIIRSRYIRFAGIRNANS